MIYVVSRQQELFNNESFKCINVEESLALLKTFNHIIQVDTETNGKDAHINKLLCTQFGNMNKSIQIVVDNSTIDIRVYKEELEQSLLIFQNGKFDLQFFFNYGIVPLNIWDTMIIEQLLHLGFPSGLSVSPEEYEERHYDFPYHINKEGKYQLSYALDAICDKRLGIKLDKSIRGKIRYLGLDYDVITYAAHDVVYLYDVMESQKKDLIKQGINSLGIQVENYFVPAIAYLEWCGIHLDIDKWKVKMVGDKVNLDNSKRALDNFIIKLSKEGFKAPYKDSIGNIFYKDIPASKFAEYVFIDRQGDLFSGFNLEPQIKINWSSSQQVVKLAKLFGFNTTVQDKKTGEDKDSVLEKQLKGQKGICDEFLKLYFDYQGYSKVVTSFGQGHINAVNPNTHRIHTIFKQLGTTSGRMSCGSQQPNDDLAKLNKVKPSDCTYPNIQQLPADEQTREAFTSEEGNLMVDCDFSALESRLGADIYNEPHMIDEFLHGSGDIHSLMAKTFFEKEIGADTPTKEIKKKFPELRKKAKSPEFLIQFGGSAFGLAKQLGCSEEEAQRYVDAYYGKFKGIKQFKEYGSRAVRQNGYVLINPITGHKMYWWDWQQWKEEQQKYTSEFWDEYKMYHKGTGDEIAKEVKHHFQVQSKYDRMALNAPTQGTGAIIIKTAAINLLYWIVNNNLFGKVKLCAMVHDELLVEFPKELKDTFPHILEDIMFNAAAFYCKKVPIPAEAEVSDHWVH